MIYTSNRIPDGLRIHINKPIEKRNELWPDFLVGNDGCRHVDKVTHRAGPVVATSMAAPHSGWSLDCKVYIGGLGADADKQALEKAFARYGVITNFWVARNPPGFAFVEYELPSDAEDAVRGLNGIVFEGRRLRVEMSTGKSRREVRPWYKAGDDDYKYSSRSRTRSRSRSRYSSRSSRSWSRGRSRRRTRSSSSRYRYRHYSSSSRWSSASSRRRSRTPSLRRKRHYSSSGSYYSRSPGRSVSPRRRGRSRKRSGSSPKEAIRSRSKTRRSRSSSDSRIRDASVPPDDDSVDLSRTMVVDETCSDKADDPEEYIERNVDDRISVAVQTDYFLLLHFIEKAPDVMTETFLRVDRDKVLNSSNLPEIIPTVYQLPRRGIRDIRRSSNVQVNAKKRSGGQVKTKTTASKAKSKASSSDEMITKDDKAMQVDDRRNARDQRPKKQGFAVSETSKANCSNHVGSDIDADKGGNKLGSPPLKDKRLDTPATDTKSAISSSPRQDNSKRSQDPEEKDKNLGVSRDQRECKDKDGKKLKQGNTVFEETERRKKVNKEGIQKHQKEDKHSECEHSDGDMKSVEKTDKRSNAERKDRIKFQVRQQRAMILSERRDPGQGRNGQSKFDRLREKPDSSSDDDCSSDSASSRKKPRLAKEHMPSSPNNKSDVLMEGNDALPEKKGSHP